MARVDDDAVTETGMLIGSAAPKPPYSVYLLISTQDAKGNVTQWAVEGVHRRAPQAGPQG